MPSADAICRCGRSERFSPRQPGIPAHAWLPLHQIARTLAAFDPKIAR